MASPLRELWFERLSVAGFPRLLRFGVAGLTSTLCYLALSLALRHGAKLSPISASISAYLASLFVSYLLQSRFTFRVREDSAEQITRFAVTAWAGLALCWGITCATEWLKWPYLFSTLLICVIVPIVNYFIFKGWVFTRGLRKIQRGVSMKTSEPLPPTQDQIAKDFDTVAGSYRTELNKTLAFTGKEHFFFVEVKRDHIVRLAQTHFPSLSELSVLDFGCGVGAYHEGLKNRFAQLHGIDVSAHSIEIAAALHPFVRYSTFDGTRLPYEDQTFSLIFAVCVMHHVPPGQWESMMLELNRVTKPGGLMLIFEHNPYNPATQYVVKTCDIDKDAVLLRPTLLRKLARATGFKQVETRTIISVPPSTPLLKRLDALLGRLPFGAQYYLSAVKPRA